jgi:hypothetical protein
MKIHFFFKMISDKLFILKMNKNNIFYKKEYMKIVLIFFRMTIQYLFLIKLNKIIKK